MRGSAPVERQRAARHRGAHTHPLQEQEPASGADPRISLQTLVLPSPFSPPHPTRLLLCRTLQFKRAFLTRQSTSPVRASMGKSDKKDKKRKRDSSGSSDSSDRSLGQMARARVHPGLAYIYICQPMPVHCSMQGASGS